MIRNKTKTDIKKTIYKGMDFSASMYIDTQSFLVLLQSYLAAPANTLASFLIPNVMSTFIYSQ